MKTIMSRTYNQNETLSSFFVLEGEKLIFSCKTIELASNGNRKNISCINEGMYWAIKYDSPAKGLVFLLLDVPGRDAIEIHAGNFVTGERRDSLGCILPGAFFFDINNDGHIDIGESRKTMDKLLALLPEKFQLFII